jgi:hypothetical protein
VSQQCDNYFTVSTRGTIKRVNFTWCCRPDEDAEQIAAVLNTAVGDYLRALSAARLERTPEVKHPEVKRTLQTTPTQQNTIYQNMSEAMRQSASAALRKVKAEKETTKRVTPAPAPGEALALLFHDVREWKSKRSVMRQRER